MYLSWYDIRLKGASSLLVVFLLGGLLAPVMHWVDHGESWAIHLSEAQEHCDHSEHGDSFENPTVDPEQNVHCVLENCFSIKLKRRQLRILTTMNTDPFSKRLLLDRFSFSVQFVAHLLAPNFAIT